MKKQLTLAALMAVSLALTACSKQDKTTAETESSTATAVETETVSAAQQAAIDSIDQPILDEKNQDIPAEIANAPADTATPVSVEASASSTATP